MAEPTGVPSVEDMLRQALGGMHAYDFPAPHDPDTMLPNHVFISPAATEMLAAKVSTALASMLAEARAEALEQAAAAVRDVRENGLPAGVTSHPYSENFERWLLARARRSVPESEGR